MPSAERRTPNADPLIRELREFAAARLADHKVPRRILVLDELPKGPTGKLQRVGLTERLGLTQPEPAKWQEKPAYTAPRTPLEELLAVLWAEVLGLEQVGTRTPFLLLGGDSVLGTQLVARVNDLLQVEVSLIQLVEEASTVAGMAQAILRSADDRRRVERSASVLLRLARLSDDELTALLADKRTLAGAAPGRGRSTRLSSP
jgi:hypothetical protein